MKIRRHMVAQSSACKLLVASILSDGIHTASHAADAISFEVGYGNETKMVRVGAQWRWETQCWKSNGTHGTHIGGYCDLTISQWRVDQFQNVPDTTQNIAVIGITPVFRLQNDSLKGLYAEAGIGDNLLSELYHNNGRKLSTAFQFGDHLGIGYIFQNNLDLGLKIQHFSNGGIKHPNQGINFTLYAGASSI
jgi:lipid A 3-O-deacylase